MKWGGKKKKVTKQVDETMFIFLRLTFDVDVPVYCSLVCMLEK